MLLYKDEETTTAIAGRRVYLFVAMSWRFRLIARYSVGKNKQPKQKMSLGRRIVRISLRSLSVLLAILFVIVVALCSIMWVLARGPSPTAQQLFVKTVKETSAVGFLADMFLSEEEIESIMGGEEPVAEFYDMDVSLITPPAPKPPAPDFEPTDEAVPVEDNIDEEENDDGSGIELHHVVGSGYLGYMMIVHDPMRLFVATPNSLGGWGMSLMDMVRNEGAAAGINGGGFYDPDGVGTGGIPDGLVIQNGQLTWGAGGGYVNVIGFDADGILHVGNMAPSTAMNLNLQWAASFGPTLISNGVAQNLQGSGINPRTAIGQRADGAVLMLVVEGRQIDSLGATLSDLIEIFLNFGAVNAANLDGGSSSLMMLDGEIVNRSASVVGPRYLPTAFLVRDFEG